MSDFNGLVVPRVAPQSVEIDPSCHCAYIRFKVAKVHKTITRETAGTIVAVDLDSKGQVIGVELVGVKEFSIVAMRQFLPTPLRNMDFERARFMPANEVPRQRSMQPA